MPTNCLRIHSLLILSIRLVYYLSLLFTFTLCLSLTLSPVFAHKNPKIDVNMGTTKWIAIRIPLIIIVESHQQNEYIVELVFFIYLFRSPSFSLTSFCFYLYFGKCTFRWLKYIINVNCWVRRVFGDIVVVVSIRSKTIGYGNLSLAFQAEK